MRDDQDFNINFVQLVEQHPCLYDHTLPDYHRTRVQDQAWKVIANEIKESVLDCKSRWKNLRGRYTKHLREYMPPVPGTVKKRPYYLAEFLAFIEPFTKTRLPKSNASQANDDTLSEIEILRETSFMDEDQNQRNQSEKSDLRPELYLSTDDDGEEEESIPTVTSLVKNFPRKRKKENEFNAEALDKSRRISDLLKDVSYAQNIDDDRSFFDSLLPHVKVLSRTNKLRCRIKLLQVVMEFVQEEEKIGPKEEKRTLCYAKT